MSEATLRLAAFAGVLATMLILEALAPRRLRVLPRLQRWGTNLSIVGIGALVVRLLATASSLLFVPLIAVAAAVWAGNRGWGLLNLIALPEVLKILLAVIVLDFAVWLQHVLSHVWRPLWQLHKVHHADRDLDATSGLRFHPIEIGLSMIYKVFWVLVLGPPAMGVVAFEITLNASAMFNHANWAMPEWADRWIRMLFVTPDMHRVHHSVHRSEHNSNYGFCLSIWDRIFGTYTAQPRDGHEAMTIGLPDYQTERPASLIWCLRLPFVQRKGMSTRSRTE